jgi:hypothetical protein
MVIDEFSPLTVGVTSPLHSLTAAPNSLRRDGNLPIPMVLLLIAGVLAAAALLLWYLPRNKRLLLKLTERIPARLIDSGPPGASTQTWKEPREVYC